MLLAQWEVPLIGTVAAVVRLGVVACDGLVADENVATRFLDTYQRIPPNRNLNGEECDECRNEHWSCRRTSSCARRRDRGPHRARGGLGRRWFHGVGKQDRHQLGVGFGGAESRHLRRQGFDRFQP